MLSATISNCFILAIYPWNASKHMTSRERIRQVLISSMAWMKHTELQISVDFSEMVVTITLSLLTYVKWSINWDSAECISLSTDYYQQLTLESCFYNLERTPLIRCQQLPAPYKRLINNKQNKPDRQANQTHNDQSVFTTNNNMT